MPNLPNWPRPLKESIHLIGGLFVNMTCWNVSKFWTCQMCVQMVEHLWFCIISTQMVQLAVFRQIRLISQPILKKILENWNCLIRIFVSCLSWTNLDLFQGNFIPIVPPNKGTNFHCWVNNISFNYGHGICCLMFS